MRLKLTRHAIERAEEMKVPLRDVKDILDAEDATDYPSSYAGGYRIAVAGDIAVPYSADGYAITVLWKGESDRNAGPGVRVGEG